MINTVKRFEWGTIRFYLKTCVLFLALASGCAAEQAIQRQDCTAKSSRELLGKSSFENRFYFELGNDAKPGLVSAIDNLGWGEVLSKVVLPDARLVISRQEIDYMAQLTCSNVQWKTIESNTASSEPDNTVQLSSVSFTPPIASLFLYDDRIEQTLLSTLEYAEPLGPMVSGQPNKPLTFYLPKGRSRPLAVIFLSSLVLSKLSVPKMLVTKEQEIEDEDQPSGLVETKIKLDIDGDASTDILYTFEQGGISYEEEGEHFAARIYMLHRGMWYLSSQAWMGQLGVEGF